MSYIGNQPSSAAFVTDSFSGNGSTTAFTMSVAPANTSSVLVAISGVLQDPTAYSVSGTTLTFSSAPPSGTGNISARYLGIPASGVTTTAYRTVTEYTATAGQTTFSPPSYTAGYINVYRNGVRLGAADYTATNGTTVVLALPATLGDLITTESFYVSSVSNAFPQSGGTINSGAGSTPLVVQKGGTTLATFGGSQGSIEVLGSSSTAILRSTDASSYAGLRVYNDQNSALRALEIDYMGSSYAGGEQAWIGTTGAYPLIFSTNNTERIRIPSDAGGIKFPATQVASSDANTLDDYEEGTYSPTIGPSGGTYTYGTEYTIRYGGNIGNAVPYIKVGRMVTIGFTIKFSGTYSSRFYYSLPFAAATNASDYGICQPMSWYQATPGAIVGNLGSGTTKVDFFAISSTGAHSNLSVTSATEIYINLTYQAAS